MMAVTVTDTSKVTTNVITTAAPVDNPVSDAPVDNPVSDAPSSSTKL